MRDRIRIFRLVLAGAGLLLLAGLGLLMSNALAAGEREQALREEAVISRVLDELEASVAAFVATEQVRPFVQWRHFMVGTGEQLSPLARAQAQRPWLIGYFQIEPDGEFGSPLVPPEGEGELTADIHDRLALLRQHGSDPTLLALAEPSAKRPIQARQANKQMIEPQAQQAALPQDVVLQRALDQQSTNRLTINSLANDDNANFEVAPDVEQIANFAGRDEADPDVRVGSFAAAEVADEWLKLTREVWIGERMWVQGLLIDRAGLESWLEEQVLGTPELAAAIDLEWDGAADSGRTGRAFGEPFAMLRVDATLVQPLTDQSGQRFVVLLAALLALALVVVLVAVDRTLATMLARAEERERFIAAVTHELRTPLTSIRMYSEMLEQGMVGDPARQTGYHRTIRTEAERLSRLVEQVLTLARLEQAGGSPRPDEPAPLAETVDSVIEVLRPQAEQRSLSVSVDLGGCEGVSLPRDALTQILTNLVDNAIKFSAPGAGPIEIQGRTSQKTVEIVVRDRGVGVEPEMLERMFDAFVRGRRADDAAAPGTGIGLALVRSLVGQLGGRVSARGRDGGGVELRVELPG